MKKIIILLMMCLNLMACEEEDFKSPIAVSGEGETVTINKSGVFNLTISGINNTVTIDDDNQINNLVVSGFNNIVNVGNNVSIKSFIVSGADNTIYIPVGSGITFDDSGESNQLIER